ncbi:MAG: class I SAM-dependent methyltransferase [Acidobacteriota bacterium]|nr:class I SAM-dependent methyltransferase [Acidobacteriota bacterium]
MKALRLLSLLPRNPGEFYDRISTIAESRLDAVRARPSYARHDESADILLSSALGNSFSTYASDEALSQIEEDVRREQQRIPSNAPFGTFHNGDFALARLCYQIVRTIKPQIIIETGVCYGVTSAFLLQALQVNGRGHLHSVDLPPLGKDADQHVGRLVPVSLQKRWTLYRGTARRLLPSLLAKLGEINMFIHDSLHTCRNMRMEFSSAWPALARGGVLISDDIEGNSAFQELSALSDVSLSVVMEEQGKGSLLGVALKRA